MYKDAEAAGLVVVLEGPSEVAESALRLVGRFSALVQDVQAYAEAHSASSDALAERGLAVHAAGMCFLAQRKDFLIAARDALDEVALRIQEPTYHEDSPGPDICP